MQRTAYLCVRPNLQGQRPRRLSPFNLTSYFKRCNSLSMIRTQIQLPEPLYREVRRIAQAQDWSIAEVIRRGAEAVVRSYPPDKKQTRQTWQLPEPLKAQLLVADAARLRDLARSDAEQAVP